MDDIDIEVYDINPRDNWTTQQKNLFSHLEVLTIRILQKGKDITSNLGADWVTVYMTYGTFGEPAHEMYHKVCQLAKDYDFDACEDKFQWAVEKAKYKSLKKICTILKYFEIDTSWNDERIEGSEELSVILPNGVDPNFVLENGFYPYVSRGKTGYYFRTGEKSFSAQSNFVVTPLMHILSKTDNKRIIKIDNGFKTSIVDIPSRAMISLENFAGTVVEEGNFLFYGSKIHLMKIMNSIMGEFPTSYELKTLGWQPEGFFAWSNAIFKPGYPHVERFDDVGIAEIDSVNYFSPSASSIYNTQRSDDDEYENDRYLKHIESPINFEKWCSLFYRVYPEHAEIGIAFVVIALFKDIIFKVDNNCPMLSAYGEKGSGKSKFAESLSSLFLHNLIAFNLNHGTDFAFFNRLSRFRNCITHLEEFDDQVLKDDRFQSLKGAYDGAGRERGKGTNKNRTEVSRINSALLLTGQYLSTRDDNAALTRCLILPFTPNDNRSADNINAYDELKSHEKTGLTGIIQELLRLRIEFEQEYRTSFAVNFNDLRNKITEKGSAYKERVLRNYTAALNCLMFLSKRFTLPFSIDTAFNRISQDVIKLSGLISESDSLADFWNTVTYLLDTGEIQEGFHFRILHTDAIKIQTNEGEREKRFAGITKVLILRLGTIHKLYLEAFRKQNGKTGINQQSLELYISSSRAFVGKNKSQRFTDPHGKGLTTSCHVFEYDTLGISLERIPEEDGNIVLSEIIGYLQSGIEWVNISGKTVMRYVIMTSQTNKEGDKMVKTEVKTNMLDPEPTHEQLLLTRQFVTIKGVLKISFWKDDTGNKREKRTMDVHSMELTDSKKTIPESPAEDMPF